MLLLLLLLLPLAVALAAAACPAPASPRPRIVVSLNSGRTGSGWLYKLLGATTSRVVAYHERAIPEWPALARQTIASNRSATRDARHAFCDNLGRWLRAHRDSVYVETSHMFNYFHDIMHDCFPPHLYDVSVVVLQRDVIETIYSLTRNGFNIHGPMPWYYAAGSGAALLASPFAEQTDMQAAIGYLIDMDAQIDWFVRRNNRLCRQCGACYTVLDTRLETLQTPESARVLLHGLDFELDAARAAPLFGRPYNIKAATLQRPSGAERRLIQTELERYLAAMRAAGIPAPPLRLVACTRLLNVTENGAVRV